MRFEQRNGVGKPVGETLAIRAKVDQGFLCAIRVGPTVIDKHPGNGHMLGLELLHLVDDSLLVDISPQ